MATKILVVAVDEYGNAIGEDHSRAKLTNAQVEAMRIERREKGTSCVKLAKKYGCGVTTAKDICKGRRRTAVAMGYVRRKVRR